MCLWLASTLLSAPSANAAEEKRQRMVYEVYAGGIHAVQGKLDMDMRKPGRYDFIMQATTRGFLGSMIPWKGTFQSHGWRMGESDFQPQKHQSTASWRDEIDIKKYLYNKDGTFKSLTITDERRDNEKREVDAEVTDGTIDTLTAALEVFETYTKTNKCEGEAEVFDGKRRFKQIFRHQQNVELTSSKYNIYEGPAAECTVEVVPVSGDWHEKPRGWMSIQEQGREKGTMPTVWVAQLAEGQPAIPVKIRVKTDYGTLFMHLAEYESADKILVAEKRVKEEEPTE